MTLERRSEVRDTLAELKEELTAAVKAKVDPETMAEVVESVCGGFEVIGELIEPDHAPRFSAARLTSTGWDRKR